MDANRLGHWLLRLGAVLLVIGVITGFPVMGLKNPHLALSAHLTGIRNGVMLLVLGLVWPRLRLPTLWSWIGAALAAASLYGIWLALTLGAALGTRESTPLTSPGAPGPAQAEALVGLLISVSSIACLVALVIVLVGLMRAPANHGAANAQP